MHLIDTSIGFMGSSSIVGNNIPVGVGLGLGIKLKRQKIFLLFIWAMLQWKLEHFLNLSIFQ